MLKLLLVEDDKPIHDMLRMSLAAKGFQVIAAMTGKEACALVDQKNIDLVILDWMLPDMDGIKVLKYIRQHISQQRLPVLMLTARGEEENKIAGLSFGADDYMTKPVSLKELEARLRALVRRTQGLGAYNTLTLGRIVVDPERMLVSIDDQAVDLTTKEYQLLYFLMKHPNRVFTRTQLLDFVWGKNIIVEERTVDTLVMRLRKMLKARQLDMLLQTVRGMGYRFSVPAQS